MQIVVHLTSGTQSLSGQWGYLDIYDPSSGLYTQKHLLDQIAFSIEADDNDEYALVILEINGFSKIEQRLGQADSQLLYADIATQLKSLISLDDILSHYQDSSYALLLAREQDTPMEDVVAGIIKAMNGRSFETNGQHTLCKLTAGVSQLQHGMGNATDALARSQEALDLAIEHHISTLFHETTPDVFSQKENDKQWAIKLRRALTENRLKLVYQPIVNLNQSMVSASYDILLRMEDLDGTWISPTEFLESAERTGLATGLDRWVIINALKVIEEEHSVDPSIHFCIKLTEDSVCDQEAIQWIRQQLQIHKLNTRKISFELKSHVLLNHLLEAQSMIGVLAPLGSTFSLDNFNGALDITQVLEHLDVDYVKLDAKLLNTSDESNTEIDNLKAIIKASHEMGKEIVIKNVESNKQFEALEHLEVDYLQGNFFYPPSPSLVIHKDELYDSTLFNPLLSSTLRGHVA